MHFSLSAVLSFVSRKSKGDTMTSSGDPKTKLAEKDTSKIHQIFGAELPKMMVSPGSLKCPVLWRFQKKWQLRSLAVTYSLEDGSFWFQLTADNLEPFAHNSKQLIHILYEPSQCIVNLLFTTGVLALRFPSEDHLSKWKEWTKCQIPTRDSSISAQFLTLVNGEYHREAVKMFTKGPAMVIVDQKRNRPIFYTRLEQVRRFVVSGCRVNLQSKVSPSQIRLECPEVYILEKWIKLATCQYNQQRLANRSKRLQSVGTVKMVIAKHRADHSNSSSGFYDKIPSVYDRRTRK